MARKTKIEQLKEDLRKAELALSNEQALHERTKGKLDVYEEKEEERDEYIRTLEDQVTWMRHLIEDLAMPKDKIELMMKARNEIRIERSGEPLYPEMLTPHRKRY